ncbi:MULTISPECIES: MMPL family transporter [Streptomyces]|uniref:MMPL family transporter n=1 Tax=Streptomyces TaxID=1883 RepID=UPI00163BE1A2|nr:MULTISPECIES: MMPL family transporter [Streptomyces]MBC2875508.1 MMPL family transporter [Streptomyces sp. TYQ1024]UBI35746.1 MMPL family transporter [Streptomyces mobaraensis]UKW28339.1 MMPL family transporter [Streptomyces sp. TYQ1024]
MTRTARLVLVSVSLAAISLTWAGVAGLGRLTNSGFLPDGTALRKDNAVLGARYRAADPDLILLVAPASRTGDVDSGAVAEAGRALERRAAGTPGVVSAASYWSTGDPALRARDGRTALITIDLAEDEGTATRTARTLVPQLTHPQGPVTVTATGPAWVSEEGMRESRRDLLAGELIALPLTALVLLFVFRSAVAALVPLVTGVLAVTASLACLGALAAVAEISVYAANISCALGLGLAVDYGLFLVTRFREERAAGVPLPEAVARARRTAGRTVVVSAGIVALASCALFTVPFAFVRSVTAAVVLVALLSAAAAVLLVPVLLRLWDGHLERWDVFARLRRHAADRPERAAVWRRIATAVCRRPVPCSAGALALLALLAVPSGHARFAPSDARSLSADSAPYRAALRLERDFSPIPDRVLTVGLPSGTGRAALDAYARRLAALPGAAEVRTATGRYAQAGQVPLPERASAHFTTPAGPLLTVVSRTGPSTPEARRLARDVRALPAPGGRSLVTGEPVRAADTRDALTGALPLACGAAAAVTALLLGLFTRSVLIPVKAVAVAAVSLGACLGCLVYVFQDGHLRFLLGDFPVAGFLDGTLVLLVLVVAYALSVDYEVFLLARIREAYRAAGDNTASVVHGVERTGRLVTAASLIVVCAMVALTSSGVSTLKTVGTGLSVGVLVDATLVRGVLVPGLMTLAGRWNWWPPGRNAPDRTHP